MFKFPLSTIGGFPSTRDGRKGGIKGIVFLILHTDYDSEVLSPSLR